LSRACRRVLVAVATVLWAAALSTSDGIPGPDLPDELWHLILGLALVVTYLYIQERLSAQRIGRLHLEMLRMAAAAATAKPDDSEPPPAREPQPRPVTYLSDRRAS